MKMEKFFSSMMCAGLLFVIIGAMMLAVMVGTQGAANVDWTVQSNFAAGFTFVVGCVATAVAFVGERFS